MKNKIYKIIILSLILSFRANVYSQTPYLWETAIVTPIDATGSLGYQSENDFDMCVDNFGMHYIAIHNLSGDDGKGILKYTLIDNKGLKRDYSADVGGNGQHITASAICSYKGKVYIVLAYDFGTKIRIYEKENLHPISSNWVFKDQYDAGASGTLFYNPKSIDVAADDYGLHIVYGFTDGPGGGGSCFLYYLNYKLNENRWATFSGGPRIHINPIGQGGGGRPTLSLSRKNNVERAHIVYTFGIKTRDIRFNSYDDAVMENTLSTNYWGTGQHNEPYTNFEWGKLITDPRENGKLHLITSPAYYNGQIFVDSRLKSRDIDVQNWTTNPGILNQYDFIDLQLPQSAFYDTYQNDKIPVCYGYNRGVQNEFTVIEYREFEIPLGNFGPALQLFDQAITNASYGRCIMEADSQGVYVAAVRGSDPLKIEMIRKPREIRNDIKYNALWSGYIYINAPTAPFCRTAGADVEAIDASIIRLKQGTNLFVDPNDYIRFKQGSCIIFEPNAEIFEAGGQVYYETNCITWNNPTCNSAYNGGSIKIAADLGNFTVNNGGFLVINDGSTLEVGNNTKLVIDGAQSYLSLKQGSYVKLGQGASIEFKNGAYLDAYGSTFSSLNSGDVWNGIIFDKSGADNITFCTFTGANSYIEVLNDAVSSANKKTITGNTFNNGLVRLENISKCSISDNNFNSPTGSNDLLQITNNIPFSPSSWSLHIINNWFTGGGNFQLNLRGYSGNIPSFYIFNNRFQGGAIFGIYGYNISGSIKFSNFTSSDYSVGLDMTNSSLDLYSNVIKSTTNYTIWVKTNSTARLAPVASGAFTPQLEWYGGVNKITSINSNCVYFQPNAQVLTDRGSNCFNLGNLSNFHIMGDYSLGNCTGFTYYTTRNLWNEGCNPNFNITCNYNQATVEYTPCISICPTTGNPGINQIGLYITSVGDDIFDTLLITADFGPGEGGGESGSSSSLIRKSANEDRALYSQILRNKRDREYSSAIIKCKNIINDYDTSKYVNLSLDELYQNYQNIDTSGSTLMLFTELKSYIEQKMQQYETNTTFVEKSYGYFLKCLIKIGLYMDAIAGYENIMNNHPDATVRLFACWDRAAVVLLLGQGGGQSDIFMKNYELKIKRLFDKNPAHKIAKDVFERTNRINKSELPDEYVKETKDEDSRITERVSRFNPSSIKELEEKMENDNNLLLELSIKRNEKHHVLNIPKIFKLHQNYPNPFNPQTTIKYDVPRDNLVTIRIYDILGKEIFNSSEFKKTGSYEVTFDGTNFASGMYFYSMESGNFRDVKKMVLLK